MLYLNLILYVLGIPIMLGFLISVWKISSDNRLRTVAFAIVWPLTLLVALGIAIGDYYEEGNK